MDYVLHVIDMAERAAAADPSVVEVVMRTVTEDASFNHPLIAPFMARQCSRREEASEWAAWWAQRAMYFRPLDAEMLSILQSRTSGAVGEICAQLRGLALTRT
ncbi:MAG: hypothetical protein IPI43_27715 [Sandaracinaceae bacterium]|nr:hypothetical protein [Sandaracinaceae bacterium]